MPRQTSLRKRAEEKLRDSMDSVQEKYEEIEDSTVKYIKKNPVKSVAIALGIGALIGAGITLAIDSAVQSRMKNQSFWQKHNPFN